MIAAYTAASRIEAFANSFGDSGSTAISILAANYFGAKKERRVSKTIVSSLRLLALFGLFISIITYILTPMTVKLVLADNSFTAYKNAVDYLRLISLFYIFCFTGNTFAGFYEGIGKMKLPFAGAVSHLTVRVILSMMLITKYQLPAVAIATGIGWIYVNIFWALKLKGCRM